MPTLTNLLDISVAVSMLAVVGLAVAADPIRIGSRLELMVDDSLIDRREGKVELLMQRPVPREVAIVHDQPWEGSNCHYHTVFQDGDMYRMYYRGTHLDVTGDKVKQTHPQVVCYAESKDGVRWTKPELGLVEFDGSMKNNIIWNGVGSHNFVPMKDANPDCKPEARYKALGGEGGLFAFQSPDGIHWSKMSDKPVITKGAFDSQNLAFWDSLLGEYREYHREFRDGRDIMTCTSNDFLNWTEPTFLDYADGRKTQLYTNQVIPYYRAPHILLGFPTRYHAGRGPLTPLNELLTKRHKRYGTDYTDGGFMTSRDGKTFTVWSEGFLRPGPVWEGRWQYGGNYQAWGIVETSPESPPDGFQPLLQPGAPRELSIYATEGGWVGVGNRLRRYTLRVDGFVSMHAPMSGGEFVTKPLIFDGKALVINFATSAAGSVRVEIQNADGQPIPGFTLADCPPIFGDTIEHPVAWKVGRDLSALSGQPIRLRFALKDADLYALRFGP